MTSLMGYRRDNILRIQLPTAMFQTVLVLLLLSLLSMMSLACSPPQTGQTLAERIRYSKQAQVVYGKVAAIYYENKDADEDRTDYAAASVQVYCSLMGNPVPPYINISLLGMLISQCILGILYWFIWLHWIVGIYVCICDVIGYWLQATPSVWVLPS